MFQAFCPKTMDRASLKGKGGGVLTPCATFRPVVLIPSPTGPEFWSALKTKFALNEPAPKEPRPNQLIGLYCRKGGRGVCTGGTSPRFCTRLPPPVEVGRRPPGGGGLAAEEGLPRGLASRC